MVSLKFPSEWVNLSRGVCPLLNKNLTLAQVDTIKEMHDALTARLGIVSTMNNVKKNIKETKVC
jgi:hypothetical protein